jgi:hypothetical protein
MKKFSTSYLLYVLQISFIGLFVLVLLGYSLQLAEKNFFENRMFSSNVKGLLLSEQKSSNGNSNLSIPSISGEFMLYRHLVDDINEIVRGVYATSDIFGLSNYVQEGRYFNESDFINVTNTAVIGHKLLPLTYEENGVTFYAYNQTIYEVIGVFKDTGTDLDIAAYLNLPIMLANEENAGLYYVDAKDSATVSAIISALKTNMDGVFAIQEVEYESRVSYKISRMFRTLLIFSVLAAIFSLLITTVFFVTRQKYEVSVQKLCGMTKKDLIWRYGKRNVLATAMSFALIVIAMFFLSRFENSIFSIKTLSYHHYIITGISLLAMCAILTHFTIKLAEGINISDILKGR